MPITPNNEMCPLSCGSHFILLVCTVARYIVSFDDCMHTLVVLYRSFPLPAAECLNSDSGHSYCLTASTSTLSPSDTFISENLRSSSAAVLHPLSADEAEAQVLSNESGNVPETVQCSDMQTVKQHVVLKDITNWKTKNLVR